MSRPRAGLEADGGLLRGRELSAARIEVVDHDPVRAEVARVRVTVRRVEHDAVRVRPILPLMIRAGARVLSNVNCFTEPAALLHRKHRDVPAEVVRDEHEAARLVGGDVAGRAAHRGLAVDETEASVPSIHVEGADRAALRALELLRLFDGVETEARAVE